MPRYFAELAYKGSLFHGWQLQNNAPSIQEELNKALSRIGGESVTCLGCGRTDTGVHAAQYYAHFDLEKECGDSSLFCKGVNAVLPADIRLYRIIRVNQDAHARYQASSRRYVYVFSEKNNPFLHDYYWQIRRPVNINRLNHLSARLLGEHDFRGFCTAYESEQGSICTLSEAHWNQVDDCTYFSITANRFLRGMVRTITGTLLDLQNEEGGDDRLQYLLQQGQRSDAGQSVPAKGLFLQRILYPFIDHIERKIPV